MKNLILTLVLVSTNAYARPFWAEKAQWEEESTKKVFFVGIAIGAKSEEEGRKLSLDAAQAEVRGYLGFSDLNGFNLGTQMIAVEKNPKGGYDVYRLSWSTIEFVEAFWIVKAKDYANAPAQPTQTKLKPWEKYQKKQDDRSLEEVMGDVLELVSSPLPGK